MPAKIYSINKVGERELAMERSFDAPRELVWKAWTEEDRLMKWWGPKEWPSSYHKVDLRVGGVWHYAMKSIETGEESWGKAVYREIVPIERLGYTDSFSDKDGNEFPPKMDVNLTFIDQGNRTLLKGQTIFASTEDRDKVIEMGFQEGMGSSLERLDEHLAAQR